MITCTYYDSPLGPILMELDDGVLCGLWFIGQKHFPKRYESALPAPGESVAAAEIKAWLDSYFAGEKPDVSALKLAPGGTAFQQRVWEILRSIDYGKTMSYGEIAGILEAESGGKMSAQAVGAAVGRNPISIIIPCHRVIAGNGNLTGYAGGLERKTALLLHEMQHK